MQPLRPLIFAIFVSLVYCHKTTLLQLERAFPVNHNVKLDQLRARDRARHARMLQNVVVDFPVQGISDPFLTGFHGNLLYYTKVTLGSPPREFHVQIDTGSDILWVSCSSCSNCPQSSGLGVSLNFFDVASSSTGKLLSCSDPMCSSSYRTTATQCSQNNQCSYAFRYGDGSGTSGYYVFDTVYFDAILGQSVANSSAPIIFGCSIEQSGDLTESEKAVDGIFGFGRGKLSVMSQLSNHGIAPKIFSHCLKGDSSGGGVLVIGEIVEPSLVYSPLHPSSPHYRLNLQSIAVNGQLLQIDPEAFATSDNQETIIDTGTTLAYLVDRVYDPLVGAVSAVVSQYANSVMSKGDQCYLVAISISNIFPPVSLNFAGGASMVLKPEQYLVQQGSGGQDGTSLWCFGFQRSQDGETTILGDLVLKDKIFVYDLVNQRIGWADYNCSSTLTVSPGTGKEYISERQFNWSNSSREMLLGLLHVGILAALIQILMFIES